MPNIVQPYVIAESKEHLQKLIHEALAAEGYACDLNHIDVSRVTDMSSLFYGCDFNGDVSRWNVSNVQKMEWLFYKSPFNGDISNWNVSRVKNMWGLFDSSKFMVTLAPGMLETSNV